MGMLRTVYIDILTAKVFTKVSDQHSESSESNGSEQLWLGGECGSGRTSVVNACLKQSIVRGSNHATVRYIHSRCVLTLLLAPPGILTRTVR